MILFTKCVGSFKVCFILSLMRYHTKLQMKCTLLHCNQYFFHFWHVLCILIDFGFRMCVGLTCMLHILLNCAYIYIYIQFTICSSYQSPLIGPIQLLQSLAYFKYIDCVFKQLMSTLHLVFVDLHSGGNEILNSSHLCSYSSLDYQTFVEIIFSVYNFLNTV